MKKEKDEFRKRNTKQGRGHPAYIYMQKGKEFYFVGITHAEITDGIKNIPLEKNPEPKKKRKAYMRPKTETANKSSFGKKLKGWKMTEKDKKKIKKIK